jgi:hypothetical protein
MVDTRCADPDLQLDVDIMILEYTLYQAVKAQFDFLSCAIGSGCHQDEDEGTTQAKAISSTRVLSIFDSFIYYFNATYPSHVKSTEFFDNLNMLEFLVLLSSRSSSSATTTTTTQFSDNMPEKLQQMSSNNIAARRRWLAARERQTRKLSKQPQPQPAYSSVAAAGNFSSLQDDVEDQICNAWKQNQHQHDFRTSPPAAAAAAPTSNNSQLPLPLLFDLIPRFMDVSAEISALLGHHPNETWMHIAGQFMLQASLEALQIRTTSTRHLVHGNETRNHTLTRALPRLDDCFAWGYVDPSYLSLAADVVATDNNSTSANPSDKSKSSHDLDDEMVQLVNELFCDPSEPTDCSQRSPRTDPTSTSSSLRLKETPEWTSIRTTYLSEFSIASDASTSSQSCRLDRLTTKYPLAQFLDELISFMRNIWDLFCTQLHAKPVLAQIEEDGCFSLSLESTLGTTSGISVQKGVEFDGFLARVGLFHHHKNGNGNGILSLDPTRTRLGDDEHAPEPETEPELGLRRHQYQYQSQPVASRGGFVSSGNAWSQGKLRLRPSI